MTRRHISQDRIDVAKLHLQNVDAIAQAAEFAGISFAMACTYAQIESGGYNVYGHDAGGVFSTGSRASGSSVTIRGMVYAPGDMVPVTEPDGALFLWRVAKGETSNGIGLYQITYPGYFPMMLDLGYRPWVPLENAAFALSKIIKPNLDKATAEEAFGLYNGGPKWKTKPDAVRYSQMGMEILHEWHARFKGL